MKNTISIFLLLFSINAFSQATDSATMYYNKGMQEMNERRFLVASNNFNQSIQLNPSYTNAYLQNGLANKEMRRTDAAKLNFVKAYELDNNNEQAIAELVNIYYNYRQYQQAIDMAQKCKSCDNKDRIIAMSYFQMEDYGKAEKILIQFIDKNPQDAEATYTLARTYLEMGLEKKAIPYYKSFTA